MVVWHLSFFNIKDYVCHSNQLGYFNISHVDVTNIQIILTDNIDRLMIDLDLWIKGHFYLLLGLVSLNLNVKKGYNEFWGNLWCYTAPYI